VIVSISVLNGIVEKGVNSSKVKVAPDADTQAKIVAIVSKR
jgi:hypothetical protein